MSVLHHRLRLAVALFAAVALAGSLAGAAPAPAEAQPPAPDAFRTGAPLASHQAKGDTLIRLMAGAFDPLAEDPPVGQRGFPTLREEDLGAGEAAYWLVQAKRPDFAATRAAMDRAGAVTVGGLRGGVYLVRATAQQREAFAADRTVRWSGLFQPGWKVPLAVGQFEALVDLEGPQTYLVYAFDDSEGMAEAPQQLAALDGVAVNGRDGRVTEVRATSAQLPAIAAIAAVEWIEAKPTAVPLNMEARWVNDTGVRDVQSTMTDGRLTGEGQTAGVADTGVNYTTDSQGRALSYFRDCVGDDCKIADWTQKTPGNAAAALNDVVRADTTHRKMAAYFDLGASGPEPTDDSAHGSHVSGSVTGDTREQGGAWETWDRADGMAPAARLVHQNIATPGGGLSTPSDTYRLFAQAYRPREPAAVAETANRPALQSPRAPASYVDPAQYVPDEDARTHNNSYGLIVPSISTGSAEQADRFVWNNEDMVIVSSAGNSGPDPFSIGAPSLGKNVMTSGASANGRQPMSSIDSMAIFSSHGPTADGRLGVDLATPGQIVVSAKGGSDDDEHYLQGTSMSGPILTGLSTLVRQYFWDGYGPGKTAPEAAASGFSGGTANTDRRHNPSAALVRAAMVNGAERMRGYYTGDDGDVRAQDGQYPSAGQGFGLVNLRNSLFFDDEEGRSELTTWFRDVYRGDADAFGAGTGLESREYQIKAAEGAPLNVTLAYTDAPTPLPAGSPAMVNDLDLVVTSPSGTTYVGNNFNTRANPGADEHVTLPGELPAEPLAIREPVEKVRIAAPETGTWTVTVRANEVTTGPQGFALAANGHLSEPETAFQPGDPLQSDVAGSPSISNVGVEYVSGDILKLKWSTDEPTTGTVTTTVGEEQVTYIDSYNVGDGGFYGIDEANVETSEAYGNKPVLGTQHEAYITGLSAGQTYQLQIKATDLAGNEVAAVRGAATSEAIYGAQPRDIGQLVRDNLDPVTGPVPVLGGSGWKTGTQLYAGQSGGQGLLGAFMFRLPESLDPDRIAGAAVEMTSAHVISNLYTDDVRLYVDLLDESVEPEWGTQTYSQIRNAPALTRTSAETGYRRGGGKNYPFTFTCRGMDELRATLATVTEGERRAAFRFDAVTESATSLFSTEFGFNRRSKGPDRRPRLVLYLDDGTGRVIDPVPATGGGDAPVISELGVQEGIKDKSVTVSWRTDVASDSVVLYREKGADAFTQVGSRSRSTVHLVQVFGLDRAKDYEFAVRSETAGGDVTVDDNAGEAYDFFRPLPADVEKVDWFFHGEATDEAQKTAQFGGRTTATFNRDEPTAEPPVVQKTTGLANMSFVANPLTAYWTGDYSGELNGPITIDAYFSTTGRPRNGAVNITVFADPDFEGDPVQPNKIVASGSMKVALGPVPQRSVGTLEVKDGQQMVDSQMLVQIGGASLTDEDLLISYDSPSTPSKFQVPVSPPPVTTEVLPKVGPKPAPSAEAASFDVSGLSIRKTPARRDVAAGTGFCASALTAAPDPDPDPDPDRDPDPDPDRDRDRDHDDDDDGDGGDQGVGDAGDERGGDEDEDAVLGGNRRLPATDPGPLAATGATVLLLLAIAAGALLLGSTAVREARRRRKTG